MYWCVINNDTHGQMCSISTLLFSSYSVPSHGPSKNPSPCWGSNPHPNDWQATVLTTRPQTLSKTFTQVIDLLPAVKAESIL